MKRLLGCIVALLILCGGATYAASPVSTLATMKAAVRQMSQMEDVVLHPDSTLGLLCNLALLQTSIEAGGVEEQFRILTVTKQSHYLMPDTVVSIEYAEFLSDDDGEILSIRQWPPQFVQDGLKLTTLGPADEENDAVPAGLNYWADTLQMMPSPIRDDDTLLIKCFVEHPYLSADSMALRLNPAYHDAALKLTCSKLSASVRDIAMADWWEAKYDKAKAALLQRFARPIEALPSELNR